MPNPLTHPASSKPFSRDVFANPGAEYRGAPFWGWVTKQDLTKTVAQVGMFKEMGFGGFHMHTRVGLDIPYMGEEFMAIVKGCVARAKETGLLAYLYDEDRWPSGFAGGKVLEGHPELRGLHLLWTPWKYGEEIGYTKPTFPIANAAPVRSELGTLVASYAIQLDASGKLLGSRRLGNGEEASEGEAVWYAYAEPLPNSGFFGEQTYPDLLSADMTRRFIALTHDVYKDTVGEDFGNTVPSIFTDEPQYAPISTLDRGVGKQDVFLPWTLGIEELFAGTGAGNLLDILPHIIYDSAEGEPALARYKFIDLVGSLFATNYLGEISKWCAKNGIFSTGHMNAEPRLATQTAQTGDVMRCYADMDVPGIDMLCDSREYNTAKQASSVARQFGRSGVMSELYGVTGWSWTFEGHKGQGDWQAALGVTLRVPHLFWSSMAGEAKRDYPACIGYQSPWWREYKGVEDHFARVNSVLTRGRAVTRVAVIHPVESYWLCFGPKDANFEELEYRDKAFADLTSWLLLGHIDFDFISESLLPNLTAVEDIGKKLPVGEAEYDVVVVPNLRTIRQSTLERLERFAAAGGRVIWAGSTPTLVDAVKPKQPLDLAGDCITWSKARVLETLVPYRDIDMTVNETTLYRTKGYRADSLMYQLRADGADRFLFICNTDRKESCPVDITLKGEWAVEVLDTMSGNSWRPEAEVKDGRTRLKYYFDGCESVVFRLNPASTAAKNCAQRVLRKEFRQDRDLALQSVTLSEPNALLLDYAKWKWDGKWEPTEEVLRIDQTLRERLGFFRKGAKIPQPHTVSTEKRAAVGKLLLQLEFSADIAVESAKLAIETPQSVSIRLDGETVPSKAGGWWVDQDIATVPLPPISEGKHILELEYGYGPLTALERVYILGDFGVDLRGRKAKIVEYTPPEWGDITRQGMPFYTGNVTYHCTLEADGEIPLALRVAHYGGPVVSVDVDGKRVEGGLLIHEPRMCYLGVLSKGTHKVDVTCFGDRQNAFGPIHLVPGKTNWIGADAWRSDFDWWSEEYILSPIGVFNAPRVMVPGVEIPKQIRRGLLPH